MSTKYIKKTDEDYEIIMKSSLSVKVDRHHLNSFYECMCRLEYRYLGDNKDWFSSLSDIEEYSGFRQKQITDYIKCLEELGLLRVVRSKYSKETGKRTEVNHYKILGSTMNHGDEESKPQTTEEPRGKRVKEQPAQPAQVKKAIETKVEPKKDSNPPKTNDKAIETKDDEWERAAYCVGNDDDFNSIIEEDMGAYNDEPEKDSNPNPPETNDKVIESQPEVDDNRTNHEPKDPIEDLYLSAARKLKANGLTREITQQIKAKVTPDMSIKQRMEIVCYNLYDYANGLSDDEYRIAMERISAAAYEEAVDRAEQKNRTLEELNAPDFKDEGTYNTEVNDAVADFQIQKYEGMYKEAVA